MPTADVRQLAETARSRLKEVMEKVEPFLNGYTLWDFAADDDDAETIEFYRGLLSDLRHLLVFAEVVYEKLGVALRRAVFDADFTERALYETYHQCVNAYFYPKNEGYSEDGRYAYTGQDTIRFRMKPVRPVRDIVLGIAHIFEELREELAYYESEYMIRRRMQGQK